MRYWVRINYNDFVFSSELDALRFAKFAKLNHRENDLSVEVHLITEEEYHKHFETEDED